MCVVQALTADLPVQSRDLRDGLLAPVAAAFLARKVPLGYRELVGGGG
jgi:hypothetical protein